MYSPVRMCQPTSASTNRDCQPAAPELRNSHAISATKRRSASEGTSNRPPRLDSSESMPFRVAPLALLGKASGVAEGSVARLDSGVMRANLRLLTYSPVAATHFRQMILQLGFRGM